MTTTDIYVEDSQVESVVIYQDRAQITRLLKVQSQQGLNRIKIGLKTRIHPHSLLVDCAGACVLDVIHEPITATQSTEIHANSEKLQELTSKLETEEETHGKLGVELVTCRQILSVLESYAMNIHTSSKDKPLLDSGNVGALESFLDVHYNQRIKIESKRLEVEKQMKSVEKSIESIRKEIQSLTQSKKRIEQVIILVESASEQELNVKLHYLVSNAKWTPLYNLRVNSDSGQLDIVYKASITQTTGEDWIDSHIKLSSSSPFTYEIKPEFKNRLSVDIAATLQPKGLFGSPAASSGLFGSSSATSTTVTAFPLPASSATAFSSSVGGGFRPSGGAQQSASTSGLAFGTSSFGSGAAVTQTTAFGGNGGGEFSTTTNNSQAHLPVMKTKENKDNTMVATFEIPSVQSIPSDSSSHGVTVAILKFNPVFKYSCSPKLSQFVFINADITNDSEYAILKGPASIYIDGNFLCKSILQDISPGEKVLINLGVDPGLRVNYPSMEKVHDQVGLMSKSNIIHHTQRIKIKNAKSSKVEVELVEQLPISSNSKIVVNLVQPQSSETKVESTSLTKDLGLIEWKIELEAHQEKEFLFKYDITYPLGEILIFN